MKENVAALKRFTKQWDEYADEINEDTIYEYGSSDAEFALDTMGFNTIETYNTTKEVLS